MFAILRSGLYPCSNLIGPQSPMIRTVTTSCLSSTPYKLTVCSLFSLYLCFYFPNPTIVNAVPYLASGLQVLGTLTAITALSSVLSFTFCTFLRPGVSVRNDNTSFTLLHSFTPTLIA